MPTYRSITISLVSQFDILTIPEYAPPTTPTDPFSNAPTLVNPDHSLVSVYIPTYPSSQFWLSYSISPPHPPKSLYYFKLYLNRDLVVSWGCGEDDDYRGKTMFGLFKPARTSGLAKGSPLERRVLCFCPDSGPVDHPTQDNLSDVMEIKVFRSKARKRIKPEAKTVQSAGVSPNLDKQRSSEQQVAGGINLIDAGTLPDRHPQRYYKYALLDPLDTPFATFRYYYRSWDQLEALGVISPYSSDSSSVTSIDSSPIKSQRNLATTAERPLSPQASSNTLDTHAAVSTSSDNTDTLNRTEDPKNSSPPAAPTSTTPNKTSPEASHNSKTTPSASSPTSSPLKIPFFLPRPPTPPPTTTPRDLPTLASKESFASLIRNRLPSPDPSAFHLDHPAKSIRDLSPASLPSSNRTNGKRTGTGSLGVLMNVVHSATSRRRREAAALENADCEAEASGSERTDGEAGESVSVGSGSEGGGKCGGREKKEKKKGPEERKRERRRNLWEEL